MEYNHQETDSCEAPKKYNLFQVTILFVPFSVTNKMKTIKFSIVRTHVGLVMGMQLYPISFLRSNEARIFLYPDNINACLYFITRHYLQ